MVWEENAWCLPNDCVCQMISLKRKEELSAVATKQFTREPEVLLSGVPQGSILGPILFNNFINDLFYRVKESELHNFADDNTISSAEFSVQKLLKTLERETQIASDWFKENNMIVNADKFEAIIVKRNSDMCNQYTINIDGNQVTSEKSVKLLGINIDNKLSFDEHVPLYVKKQVISLTQ